MSPSDQESMSESCSPSSCLESPRSSPSQQVPHLATCFTELTCAEHNGFKNTGPFLRIVEQPVNLFRFRYKSEMVGTHGCLVGKTSASNKAKTHPMVELVNYNKKALIRCRLAQHLKPDEHPHQLLEDEQEDRDVSAIVPEHGSYRVGFAGMGIIHTAKKDVPSLLYKKYKDQRNINSRELMAYCESEAKAINLNIVRLKFSAHDIETDQQICEPVFSEPIHNEKSAATNGLKICRISRLNGRPKGGEDVYILVEKVNKKNIDVRFVERNEAGEECWSAKASFLQNDVHHQYAIVFRTPAYKDQEITTDVKVSVELYRPSDGRSSEPKEFTYRADPLCRQTKKRKTSSPYSSWNSSLGTGSIKSLSDLPATVLMLDNPEKMAVEVDMATDGIAMPNAMPQITQDPSYFGLGEALMGGAYDQPSNPLELHCTVGAMPMMPQCDLPPINMNSAEFTQIGKQMMDIPPEQRDDFSPSTEVESEPGRLPNQTSSEGHNLKDKLPSKGMKRKLMDDAVLVRQYILSSNSDLYDAPLVADSGRGKVKPQVPVITQVKSLSTSRPTQNEENIQSNAVDKSNNEYTAVYTAEHGQEVKKLVNDICELIRSKRALKKHVVKEKLQRLFQLRLSNGDTFLHMTLCNNRTSFEYIVKLIHTMKMHHLLNLTNDLGHTILHTAILNDIPDLMSFLISNGCDPCAGDRDGNSAAHYAAARQACLQPLLAAVRSHGVPCDLNAENKEKQTALHLAVVYGADPASAESSQQCVELLLQHGASHLARDLEGRTPLHLAAYDDCLLAVRALLQFIPPSEIDAVDGRGNTALQIACGGEVRPNTAAIVKLLLEKQADPTAHEAHAESAWRLVADKPELRALLAPLVPAAAEVKSEPDEDFESADEGEDTCLSDLSLYLSDVSRLLDASGAWRALAARLQHDALVNWYQNTASPTRTLLHQVKECQDSSITSKTLILMLEDLGEKEAARLIRRRIGCSFE